MKGKLYGVGVGPGDPELLTLKAKRILEKADCIAVPKTAAEQESTAMKIISAVVEKPDEVIELLFPMSFDEKVLGSSWNEAIAKIKAKLDEEKSVAFITLGDPTVYSTYSYVHKVLKQEGYETEIIPGITSFCASAARTGISLGENKEAIAVVPSAYECENLDSMIDSFDNIVLMKVSKSLSKIKTILKGKGLDRNAVLVSKCGFDDEIVEYDLEKASEEKFSYFTTMIIKKHGVK